MRVVHIARSDCQGGAARSAHRLHLGLLALGHESTMLVAQKFSNDPPVQVYPCTLGDEKPMQRLKWVENRYVTQNRSDVSNTYFSLNEPGWDVASHEDVLRADVINLHWVAGFQSPRAIARLLSLGKPVVWTLHDQRPFTGGCHFSAGCDKFERDCRDCPQLRDDSIRLARAQLADAKEALTVRNLTVVCPSQWMARAVSRSAVLGGFKPEVIPYGLDTELFRPRARLALRQELQLPPDATCLLFGADNANEKRKGFAYLVEALRMCAQDSTFQKQQVVLVCLGHASEAIGKLGVPVINTGYVTDDERIAAWYAAADMFVLPSLEDNLPNTVLEAMSAGAPVVAFASGGIPEAVHAGETGNLVPVGDSGELSRAILNLVGNAELRAKMGANARSRALKHYTLEAQAQQYQALYQILTRVRLPASTHPLPPKGPHPLPMGPHFSGLYYSLLLRAMRNRRQDGDAGLPYRRRKLGRQRLVLAWHSLRLYYWLRNRITR